MNTVGVLRWTGAPIAMPGWYDGVPLSIYHSVRMSEKPT